jgi:Flp pilus assembly protein TadD
MSTDPTLASKGTETVFPQPPGSPPPAEDARLDDAIRRADDLLVQSLRVEERQRHRRTLMRRILIPTGALIMISATYIVIAGLLGQASPGAKPAASPPAQQTVHRDPKQAAQLSQQGWALWGQQQFADAEAKFQRAVELNPNLAPAWNGLGWSQFNQGKADAAEQSFLQCVKVQPGFAGAENGLGQIYLARGKYDVAERHLLAAAKLPGVGAAHFGLARLYLLTEKWDKAATYARKLVDNHAPGAQLLLDAAKEHRIPDEIRPANPAPKDDAKDSSADTGKHDFSPDK